MAKVKRVNAKALAAALSKGSKKRKQTTGKLFSLEYDVEGTERPLLGQSCALGAIYEGAFGTPPVTKANHDFGYQVDGGDSAMTNRLEKRFKVLKQMVQLPRSVDTFGFEDTLEVAIVALNDSYNWTRGEIAAWLRKGPVAAQEEADDE